MLGFGESKVSFLAGTKSSQIKLSLPSSRCCIKKLFIRRELSLFENRLSVAS
jgi:hypothetical protein